MNTQVIDFLTNNPSSNKAAITEATGIKGLPLFNLLKKMVNEGEITIEGEANDATYSIAQTNDKVQDVEVLPSKDEPLAETNNEVVNDPSIEKGAGEQAGKEATAGVEKGAEKEKKPDVKATTSTIPRNNDKFIFNGEEFGKGPLVRAVVAQFVADNAGITYKKLKEAFPDDLLKRFGICHDVDKAREISGAKYDRYFFKEEHIIKVKDKKVVVCNQFTSENIKPFLQKAKELGYKIK